MSSPTEDSMKGSYYILLFDKEVEIKGGRTQSLIQPQPKHQKLLRGSLLEPVSPAEQWQEPGRRHRGNGRYIKLRRVQIGQDTPLVADVDCYASEVARVTKDEMELLSAISSDNERYRAYFEPDLLRHALALKTNMHVKVEVKCDTMKSILPGIIRYIGQLPNERGRQFGIELHENSGQGSSDGVFWKQRFFTCAKDSAVFVSVNKLKFDKNAPVASRGAESQSLGAGINPAARQSVIESDLKQDMEVYVSTKKGSREEYVKGKIIYIGKPTGEKFTYVGVELEKPRIQPWDGTFKSHRLCQPKSPWYSELVPINDIVPAELLEEEACSSPSPPSSAVKVKAPGRAVSVKRTPAVTANNKSNKKAGGAKKNSNESQSIGSSFLHSLTGVHANPTYDQHTYESLTLQTLPGSNDGTNNKGQDLNLKMQEQLLDNAKKASKDANQISSQKGFRKFSKEFMSKLQSLGSNKEGSTLQAGISFSAVVSGKVAMVDLESSPLIEIDESELPPLGPELIEEICSKVDHNWAFLAHNLEVDKTKIEKISGKTTNSADRVIFTLVHWWKKVHKQPQAIQTLAFALSELKLEKLAGRVLIAVAECEMDNELLDIVANRSYSNWKSLANELGLEYETIEEIEKVKKTYHASARRMLDVWDKEINIGCEKLTLLVRACRHSGNTELANELEQGLDADTLERISRMVDETRWYQFGQALGFPDDHLSAMANSNDIVKLRVYMMLGTWRNTQPFSADKILAISSALEHCGLKKLSWEICRGLDDDILNHLAFKLQKDWRRIGTLLNLPNSDMNKLATGFTDDAKQAHQVLTMWRRRQHASCDLLGELAKVLRDTEYREISDWLVHGIHDNVLDKVASLIAVEWEDLANNLGFEKADIEAIKDGNKPEAQRIYKMLCQWRYRQHYNTDRVQVLTEGLEKCGLGDVADVVLQFTGRKETASDSSPRGVLNSDQLMTISKELGTRWQLFAGDLNVDRKDIFQLSETNFNPEDKCHRMLLIWQGSLPAGNNGKNDLIQALDSCGRHDLVVSVIGPQAGIDNDFSRTTPSPTDLDEKMYSDSPTPMMTSDSQGTNRRVNMNEIAFVTDQMMREISKKVDFRPLATALNLTTKDVSTIEVSYQQPDMRCYMALDTWCRRGASQKRRIGELYQVLQMMGKTDLVKDLSPEAHKDPRGVTLEVKKDYDPQKYSNPKLTDNKDPSPELRPPAVTKEKVKEHVAMHFEDVPLVENAYELEVNSMVEFTKNDEKLYGVMRWMGYNQKVGSMAGIELEEKLTSGGTDGTLFGNRVFSCENGRAIFVKLAIVRPDSRFPSQADTFTKRKRFTSQDFGGFKSPTLKGYIHPPRTLSPEFVGRKKGIQGDQNSCYLDTTLFSMYAYSNIFDDILHRNKSTKDLHEYETVQTMLREDIVNPLRSYGFVRADRVLKLREYLDQLGTTKGLISEEKDPEEFLHTFLQEVTKTEPFLHIRQQGGKHVEKSYHYQIFMEKNESYQLPSVEQLLHYSFLHSDLQLAKVPPCLIMQMPRFGKDYRMYNRILPSLYLDISDLLEGWPRICSVCGKLAELECRDCSGKLAETGIFEAINSYCQDCSNTIHVHSHRKNHKVKEVHLSDEFVAKYSQAKENGMMEQEIHEKLFAPRKMMELFAVVCIETSHYVAFVKAGSGYGSQWVFFDSMADREGDQQGYNIPEITHLREFQSWLENQTALKETNDKDLPPPLRRLLCDGYMCMYQDPDVVKHHQKQFQQTSPIDSITEPLAPLPNVRERSASNEMQVEESLYVVPNISSGRSSTSSYGFSGSSQHSNFLDAPTPAISYTAHRGSLQGSASKAAANAALCYRNYADALTTPPGSTAKGVSDPVAEYGKYAEVGSLTNGSKQHVFSTPGYKPTQHQQQPTTYRNRGSSLDDELASNSSRQHVGQIGHDDDSSRRYGSDTSSIHSRDSQYTSLPSEISREYKMPLSNDADVFSRPIKDPSVIVNQQHHIRHPPSRNDFSNVTDVVADAPIPRTHPARVQVGASQSQPRYDLYSSCSSSRYQTSKEADQYSRPKEPSVIVNQRHILHPPSKNDFSNVTDVVADEPIPRTHPARVQVGTSQSQPRYDLYSSCSSSRYQTSKEADQYSRPKEPSVIVNQRHILHPPSKNDFSNVTDVVADEPIPRTHPARVQVGTSQSQPRYDLYSSSSSSRYQTNSDSASRLAKHGIKQPPIEDELDNVVAGFSLQGGGTAI